MLDLEDVPGGHELPSYYARDDDRGTLRGIRDTDSIGASYDRYLRSAVLIYFQCFCISDIYYCFFFFTLNLVIC